MVLEDQAAPEGRVQPEQHQWRQDRQVGAAKDAAAMRAAQYRIAQAKQLAALENPVYTALDVTGAPGLALQRSLTPALDPVRLAGLAAQEQPCSIGAISGVISTSMTGSIQRR